MQEFRPFHFKFPRVGGFHFGHYENGACSYRGSLFFFFMHAHLSSSSSAMPCQQRRERIEFLMAGHHRKSSRKKRAGKGKTRTDNAIASFGRDRTAVYRFSPFFVFLDHGVSRDIKRESELRLRREEERRGERSCSTFHSGPRNRDEEKKCFYDSF